MSVAVSPLPVTVLSLFEAVMGERYASLPTAVQRFHRLRGRHTLTGWVETRPPATLLARALGLVLGTPRQSLEGTLQFVLDAEPAQETWTRHFPHATMRSRLQLAGGRVSESLGPARLAFDLAAEHEALHLVLVSLRVFGIPCPRWLMPRVVAEESGAGDTLFFEVSAALPVVGTITGYRGRLDLGSEVLS